MNFQVDSNEPPVVEIDSASRSAYVRFRRAGKIARTLPLPGGGIATVDLDRDGKLIGIEFLGVREFNIRFLLKKAPGVRVNAPVDQARYVPARRAPETAYA